MRQAASCRDYPHYWRAQFEDAVKSMIGGKQYNALIITFVIG
jgi:hypothetical protein